MSICKLYIKKCGTDSTDNPFPTYDVSEQFGFVTKDIPFKYSVEVKDVESNDFYDEDGDDEWNAPVLKAKAYTMNVELITKGTKDEIKTRFYNLRNYLLGRDGTGTKFMLWNDRYKIGRTDIRLVKIDDSVTYDEIEDNKFVFSINIELKVNNPITEVSKNGNNLYIV